MNQQDHLEDNEQTESLADLSVTDEQNDQTKGGPGRVESFFAFPGFSGGVSVSG